MHPDAPDSDSDPATPPSGDASTSGDAPAPTAAVLLIGDELLTGKIRDANGHFLSQVLRRRGIRLVEIRTVGDEPEEIGRALLDLVSRASIVFTSGGVGPTHDDRTLESIALATGRPLRRNEAMAAELAHYYKDRLTDAVLRMADLPEGTVLCAGPGWPAMRLDLEDARVFILPGVPGLLRAKVERLEAEPGELPQAPGWHLAQVYTSVEEARLAPMLESVLERFGDVQIGSYPRWYRGEGGRVTMEVRVTLEGPAQRRDAIEAARAELAALLPEARDEPAGDAS